MHEMYVLLMHQLDQDRLARERAHRPATHPPKRPARPRRRR